jgi:hypothetical protein
LVADFLESNISGGALEQTGLKIAHAAQTSEEQLEVNAFT